MISGAVEHSVAESAGRASATSSLLFVPTLQATLCFQGSHQINFCRNYTESSRICGATGGGKGRVFCQFEETSSIHPGVAQPPPWAAGRAPAPRPPRRPRWRAPPGRRMQAEHRSCSGIQRRAQRMLIRRRAHRTRRHMSQSLRAFWGSVRSQPTSRRAWRLLSCVSASKRSTAPTAPRVFRGRRQSSLISSEGEAALR